MPTNMKLRIVLQWEDGSPVLLDGVPLAMTQAEFELAVQRSLATSKDWEEKLGAAVEEEVEHPGVRWWERAGQEKLEQLAGEAARKAVASDGVRAAAAAVFTQIIHDVIRGLRKQTLMVVTRPE